MATGLCHADILGVGRRRVRRPEARAVPSSLSPPKYDIVGMLRHQRTQHYAQHAQSVIRESLDRTRCLLECRISRDRQALIMTSALYVVRQPESEMDGRTQLGKQSGLH